MSRHVQLADVLTKELSVAEYCFQAGNRKYPFTSLLEWKYRQNNKLRIYIFSFSVTDCIPRIKLLKLDVYYSRISHKS